MSVTVQDVAIHDERRVTVDVAGAPVLTKQYGRRQYRVDRVVITYRRKNEGPWTPSGVDLSGPYVKKDGSDGVDRNLDRLWNFKDWGSLDWLGAMVERYQP